MDLEVSGHQSLEACRRTGRTESRRSRLVSRALAGSAMTRPAATAKATRRSLGPFPWSSAAASSGRLPLGLLKRVSNMKTPGCSHIDVPQRDAGSSCSAVADERIVIEVSGNHRPLHGRIDRAVALFADELIAARGGRAPGRGGIWRHLGPVQTGPFRSHRASGRDLDSPARFELNLAAVLRTRPPALKMSAAKANPTIEAVAQPHQSARDLGPLRIAAPDHDARFPEVRVEYGIVTHLAGLTAEDDLAANSAM